ncbi:MAG: carbohydrate porin [Alphaproteobacteria bacterium]|nr:carbohydrate porin [Alphaproteobacteria bacterium]
MPTAALVLIVVLLWAGSAWAQAVDSTPSAAGGEQKSGDTEKPPAADSQPGASSKAEPNQSGTQQKEGEQSGDAAKAGSGIKLALQEQSEVWANLVGGGKQGTSYNGLTTGILDVDLQQAFGWQRARFYASAFDVHGHGPSRSLVGNNQLLSNIEATPSVKLYDLWLEQRLPGRISVRFGQEGANDEMMTTAYGAVFLNSSFGFPGLPAADLPSGGPNYPMATPFARVRWRASDQWSVTGAVFNGDPAPPGPGDPQIRDRNGTAFRLDDHALAFGELRYTPDLDAPDNLQTDYKLGAWYHTGEFADRRFDTSGGLLADPAGTGMPKQHAGDFAIYGIIDEILWRREGTKDQGIGVFLQVQAGPSDRNLADLFVEGGVNWAGPFADRPKDIAGIAFAYLGISPAARSFSRDLVAFGRASSAYASNETVIEATYKAIVTDWLTLQPDAQFVLNPNAGIPGPFGPRPLPNALVIGLRATVKFQTP